MQPLAALALVLMSQSAPEPAQPQANAQHSGLDIPSPAEIAELPPDGGPDFNRLVFSKSPYLLQHARNPVDWHEWGPAAFALAKERDVPVFLSIGYSTCHWCHVMSHESFDDPEVAKLMNEAFVCIKVDREERPDIDELYMAVTQALTGSGGWPMTVVMTADAEPFFAGTYFPKAGRGGRAGMLELVPGLSAAWTEQREGVVTRAGEITAHLRTLVGGAPGETPGAQALEGAEASLRAAFDAEHGGTGDSRKFPIPHEQRLLLRRHAATGEAEPLAMVQRTLQAWRLGGVFDHVGLGVHRYSTDRQWLLPHFEKMLYDQALCALAYVDAWLVTKDPEHERAAREILAYVDRVLGAPEGGFYSAEDADSEGEEGLFYVWTREQLDAALESEDAAWVAKRFGFEEGGNFCEEATGERTGANVLHLDAPLSSEERARWEPLRARMFTARERRIHPLLDDKVLTDWNALAIEAFARAGRAFDDDALVARAARAAAFMRANLVDERGRLVKRWRAGEAGLDGLLDDHAYAASAFLALHQATQDPAHLTFARHLVEIALEHFADDENGCFFLSPDDGEALPVRTKDAYDGARPSGNSVMAVTLVRLARLTGETTYEERAAATLAAFGAAIERTPAGFTHMLGAVDALVNGGREIVIVGDPEAEDTRAMLRTLAERYAPNDVVVLRPPGTPDDEAVAPLVAAIPYVRDHVQLEGRATAYVCRDFVCAAPATELVLD